MGGCGFGGALCVADRFGFGIMYTHHKWRIGGRYEPSRVEPDIWPRWTGILVWLGVGGGVA